MKQAHIRITKNDNKRPWRTSLSLCGSDDITNNFVETLTFCSLPNEIRCKHCKQELLKLLKG